MRLEESTQAAQFVAIQSSNGITPPRRRQVEQKRRHAAVVAQIGRPMTHLIARGGQHDRRAARLLQESIHEQARTAAHPSLGRNQRRPRARRQMQPLWTQLMSGNPLRRNERTREKNIVHAARIVS